MFTSIEDFTTEWSQEAKMTKQVLDLLTDQSLNQIITEKHRTLGRLAWHLVESIGYMTSLGLTFEVPDDNEEIRNSAKAIAKQYERVSESLMKAVKTQWDNQSLQINQTVFGEEWNNGASLRFTLMHQAHHRGQMTVLMRQAGLQIPDIYGPNYDSWIERGMEPLV